MIDGASTARKFGRKIASSVVLGAAVIALTGWAVASIAENFATGTVGVVIASPAAVTVETNPVVTVVANNNLGTGVTSQASGPVAGTSAQTRSASATEASFGLSGAPNQAVSISVPTSAVMTIGSQVVEVSGMGLSGGNAQKLGENGSGTFGIELAKVTVASAAELALTTAAGPEAGAPGDAIAGDGVRSDGTAGVGLTGPLPINRSNPFGMVTNVGPYFYVMISYY